MSTGRFSAALVLALGAAACSADGSSLAPAPTSPLATTTVTQDEKSAASRTTTPTTTPTTTVIDPDVVSIICGSAEPLLSPDLDGDGEAEHTWTVDSGIATEIWTDAGTIEMTGADDAWGALEPLVPSGCGLFD